MNKDEAKAKLAAYEKQMKIDELSERTIKKYLFDVKQWLDSQDKKINMESMLAYKQSLTKTYAVSSVNSKLISVNRYLKWLKYDELILKTQRMQPKTDIENIISKEEYSRMLDFAKRTNRMKMYYVMRTIAMTGIRIGELKYITVSALENGRAEVYNKGKYRMIYISRTLSEELLEYCKACGIAEGIVFHGRNKGNNISAVGVWKNMKSIAEKSNVPSEKAYPHSLRHLFAKTYMEKVGDVTELSDLLGHSRLETTWIYTRTTSEEKRRRLERLDL